MKNLNTSMRRTSGLALSASALALAMAAGATPAFAQDAGAESADEIVVTGIRASLQASEELKKATPTIVESITAEDIGKLPDVSIADSLSRLPGVTSQRLEGRDQRLSIRGLGPDFGVTLLNGREQVTVGDNRGVEYDQYPAEFFRNVVVHKSASANLVPAGIAGTVDLRMLRPLAQKDRILALNVRGQMNGQKSLNPDSPRYGFRGSATYVDKFADDTLGIAIGVSASHAPSQNERYNAWGFPNEGSVGGNLILGGAKPYVQSNLLKRYGAVATVEYQPTDNFHSTLDVLYSKFKETQHLRGIEFPINPGWGSGATVQPGYTVTNGLVTAATLTGVHAVQRNDLNRRDADNLSIGWNNVIGLSDTINLNVDASWSKATRTDFLLETYTGTGYATAGAADTIRISANENGTFNIVPTLDYTNTNLFGITDPRGWGYNGTAPVIQAGFLNRPDFKDDLKALRASLDGEVNSGIIKGWEIGANYSRRKKTSAFKSYFLCPKGAGTNCTVSSGTPTFAPVPSEAKVGSNVALDYLGVPAMLTLNPLYLYNNSLNSVFDNRPVSLVRDNTITEGVLTGYAMLKLDGDVGSKPVSGSIGLQVVHTNQKSAGTISAFQDTNNDGVPEVVVAPAAGKTSYTNWLPSASLSVELIDGGFVKMGASHTMVRPRLDQERINQELSFNFSKLGSTTPGDSFFSSSGGNFRLRPYESTNIDLSLEKYFAKGGYIALSGYYKSLTEFVDSRNATLFDFSPVLAALPAALRAQVGTPIGAASQPANNGKGYIFGQEASLSLPFANLSDSLDGLGFFGSISHTNSSVKLGSNPTQAITVPGLSKYVGTAEAYFEKAGFQARVSYRYRSKFLGEVAGLSANPDFRQAKAESIVDAQIGYEFQEGTALQGLSILLQAKNLTDRPFITYANNDPRQVIDYQRYGRDYYLSLSYKF
ncbi:TonB-dependent receptor [Chakrabartia godavariana]|nr:TonB-dependent receptor [Chakrabartia godavariana]